MRVLFVEDERRIASYVKRGLEEQGYAVDIAGTGTEALEWLRIVNFDIIVLDLMLPGMDGLAVCREMRKRHCIAPILMLTARNSVEDRVDGLDAGADDYLAKPFAFKELLARLRALVRRAPDAPKTPLLRFADLTMDTSAKTVSRSGIEIPVTGKAFAVLECLLRKSNHVLALDNSLAFSAMQAVAAIEVEDGAVGLSDGAVEPHGSTLPAADFGVKIWTADGKLLLQAGQPFRFPLPRIGDSKAVFSTYQDSSRPAAVRTYTLPVADRGHPVAIIQIGQSLGGLNATLDRLLVILAVGVPLLGLLGGCGGYYLVGRALAPIEEITRTAERLSAQELGVKLRLSSPDDEVGRLGASLNRMWERLHESFLREKRFTADASHELRTPLTAMLAILDAIRTKPRTPEEYNMALADLTEEASRLRILTESLLQLAQSTNAQPSTHEATDLSTLVRDVTESIRPLAESKPIRLRSQIEDGLEIRGNGDDLVRLFFNLLDNAVKFTSSGEIVVSASAIGDRAHVTVADTGRGIPADDLPYLFERFYRVDKARSEAGAGLGLSIALEIVRSHGGTINLRSAPGQGTVVDVTFALRTSSVRNPLTMPAQVQTS